MTISEAIILTLTERPRSPISLLEAIGDKYGDACVKGEVLTMLQAGTLRLTSKRILEIDELPVASAEGAVT